MLDATANKEERMAALKIYKQCFQEYITEPFKAYGFNKVKGTTVPGLARVTDNGLIQSIFGQRNRYGETMFTIGIGAMLTCSEHEDFLIEVGHRIGYFTSQKKDLWWDYENETIARKNFEEVQKILFQDVLPWLEKLTNPKEAIDIYEFPNEYKMTGHQKGAELKAAILAMRYGDLEKAKRVIENLHNELSHKCNVNEHFMENCNTLLELIFHGTREEQLAYIEQRESSTKEKLKLNVKK